MVGEFAADGQTVLVRAGVGLLDGVAGELRLPLDDGSLAGRVFHSRRPAVLDNSVNPEAPVASLNRELGVVNAVSVLIGGPSEPFGVLGADSTSPRTLSPQETTFLQAVANLLGEVVSVERIASKAASSFFGRPVRGLAHPSEVGPLWERALGLVGGRPRSDHDRVSDVWTSGFRRGLA